MLREATSGSKNFSGYLTDAEQAYRDQRPQKLVRHGLIPIAGVTKNLRRRFERILGETQDEEDLVRFSWVPMRSDRFVKIDPDTNTVYLNAHYRDAVLQGRRGSAGDAPLVKTLLMLLFRDDMARRNRMASYDAKVEVFNRLLVEAARAQQ